jgi:hypothetical protein
MLKTNRLLFISIAIFSLFWLTLDANAQTPRKKRTSKAVPVASPTPSGEPLVISRAEDFPDEGSSQPVRPEPTPVGGNPGTSNASETTIEELGNRIKSLESSRKKDPDEKQKRLLLNLDILTRSEQRAETMRKQLWDMIEKESDIKTKLNMIDLDIRPEMIERSAALAGSLRPEEIRNLRKKSLDAEKANLENLLLEVQKTKASLEQNVLKADDMVDRLRTKLEKEIDAAIDDDPGKN